MRHFRPNFLHGHAECAKSRKLTAGIFLFQFRSPVMALWSFPIGLYVEAMHLQCFPPTLRECALFRKRVLLGHVRAEYGPGCSTWFLDIFFLLSVSRFKKNFLGNLTRGRSRGSGRKRSFTSILELESFVQVNEIAIASVNAWGTKRCQSSSSYTRRATIEDWSMAETEEELRTMHTYTYPALSNSQR